MFDPILFKKQFPLFDHSENHSLVYLDNAATTQKPQCVIDAITDFYSRINANANRSSHRLGRASTNIVNVARDKMAKFIHAKSSDEVVFTSGATESINIIANGLSDIINSDDELVISLSEHHANLVPWQELSKKTGAKLRFVQPDISDIKQVVTCKTKIISVALASNTLGHILDLCEIKELVGNDPNIIFIADASQLVAHQKIDVQSVACDFLVFSAHKHYGPSGVGVLYGKKDMLQSLPPLLFGGEMISNVGRSLSTYKNSPERFEAGTSPLAALSGLVACLEFWSAQDRREMERYEEQLSQYLHKKLTLFCSVNSSIVLLTKSEKNIGIASLVSDFYSMADIAIWLDEQDIAVRVGDHCAQPLWESMQLNGTLRISLAAYNTFDDIDILMASLNGFINNFKDVDCDYDLKNKFDFDEFVALKSRERKYKFIVAMGERHNLTPDIRTKNNLVVGCEAKLWLKSVKYRDKWRFRVDSDSKIVKGLSLLVVDIVNNKSTSEIKKINFEHYFLSLGFDKHLSQSRSNGLYRLIEKIKEKIIMNECGDTSSK